MQLEEYYDDYVPKYAILSHTWGEEEVSYQALLKPDSKKLAGYEKIARCCSLAAAGGFQYVWIDTCCIDKASSADLSEAINSMYRWYQNASVCYAYMADVESPRVCQGSPLGHDPSGWTFKERFMFLNSRWFTRGWTLQELLAPSALEFYDKGWSILGTRTSLKNEIVMATGIAHEYIDDCRSASVAAKMSWASKRKITRLEDMAYCLMGLFDVNMPLLYGEGRKAFLRLQYEIVKEVDDESIFAWREHGLEMSGLFARSPRAFQDSGNIVPVEFPRFQRRDTYTMTNRGLCIDLVSYFSHTAHMGIKARDQGMETLPLHCAWRDNTKAAIGVVLKRISHDTFARVSAWPRMLEQEDYIDNQALDLEPRKVYIRAPK